jgi:hypothetical protein
MNVNDPGGIRASDAEREAVVELLRTASVEGRLTLGELTERTEAAYSAATRAELDLLTGDLPQTANRSAPPPAYPPAPAPTGKRRWFVAIMSENKRRGKWRIDQALGAVAVMGEVKLDLREAEVRTNEVNIVATAVMGSVKIIVPDGVDVELDGIAIMGEKSVKVEEAPAGMTVPVIRVTANVLMGDVKVIGNSRAEPIKRAWAAWREHWRTLQHGQYGPQDPRDRAVDRYRPPDPPHP